MTGRVVHFEVPFDDADRARSFYREVFGWQIQEMPDMGYNLVSTGPAVDVLLCVGASASNGRIYFTANGDESVKKIMDCGARVCLTKPLNMEVLLNEIKASL